MVTKVGHNKEPPFLLSLDAGNLSPDWPPLTFLSDGIGFGTLAWNTRLQNKLGCVECIAGLMVLFN